MSTSTPQAPRKRRIDHIADQARLAALRDLERDEDLYGDWAEADERGDR